MTDQESGLEFNFDKSWVLKKYDEHPFYKSLSGASQKAVDFIGIWNNEILVLIEIKNYKIRYSDLKASPIENILNEPEQFTSSIIQKVEDSLKAIDAINIYYNRQFWYRLFLPIIRLFKKSSADWPFWTQVYDIIDSEREVWVVLWFETEDQQEQLRQNIKVRIKEGLDEFTDQIMICHQEEHPFGDTLQVKLID